MPPRTVGRYHLQSTLGVGMFAKVMLAVDPRTGERFAVKIMRKESLEELDMARYARREAFVLKRLSHPNIVGFVEAVQSETKLFLVMNVAQGRELLDVVRENPLPEPLARTYVRQLVDALSYLHQKGIAHRDLKPENIIVDTATTTLKLIDFGLTGIIQPDLLMQTVCGSNFYSAPEVTYNTGDGYDGAKADAWSVGILSYILLTGVHPYVDEDGDLMVHAMRNGLLELPSSLQPSAAHFLSRLLAVNPKKRYTMAQASLHPWLTGKVVPDALYMQMPHISHRTSTPTASQTQPRGTRNNAENSSVRVGDNSRYGGNAGGLESQAVGGARSINKRKLRPSPALECADPIEIDTCDPPLRHEQPLTKTPHHLSDVDVDVDVPVVSNGREMASKSSSAIDVQPNVEQNEGLPGTEMDHRDRQVDGARVQPHRDTERGEQVRERSRVGGLYRNGSTNAVSRASPPGAVPVRRPGTFTGQFHSRPLFSRSVVEQESTSGQIPTNVRRTRQEHHQMYKATSASFLLFRRSSMGRHLSHDDAVDDALGISDHDELMDSHVDNGAEGEPAKSNPVQDETESPTVAPKDGMFFLRRQNSVRSRQRGLFSRIIEPHRH